MRTNQKIKNKHWGFAWALYGVVFFCIAFGLKYVADWYIQTYGDLGFEAILYTITSNLGGVDSNLIASMISFVTLRAVISVLCCSVFFFFQGKRKLIVTFKGGCAFEAYPFSRKMSVLLTILTSLSVLLSAANVSGLTKYLINGATPSALYENYYKDPRKTGIVFPEEKRNLVIIFLESMETSFFSESEGGALPYNVIPELHQLADQNVNFSDNSQTGGLIAVPGTGWTIGALVGDTAGIPLKTPPGVGGNDVGSDGTFLPGVVSMMDILKENGYEQAVMFGSKASFGGRLQYFASHGTDHIYDLSTAEEEGIVPAGYHNGFWGMEDKYLIEYAKQKLTQMASEEQPFAFTMLTVDTHHIGGYVCDLCSDEYTEQYENVYRCASRQIYDFVEWIKAQNFYSNTTIVIAGDHPSMDGDYIARNVDSSYDRRVYNCFINSVPVPQNSKERLCSTLDMFPTIIASIGCEIEGERLGLGTNLFSAEATLMEMVGQKEFEKELSSFSDYYLQRFFLV